MGFGKKGSIMEPAQPFAYMMMSPTRTVLRVFALLAFALLFSVPAQAQKNGNKAREFPAYGFEFKPLKDWQDVPIRDDLAQRNVIGNFLAEKGVYVKMEGNNVQPIKPSLDVMQILPQAAVTESDSDDSSDGGGGLRGRVGREAPKEVTSVEYILSLYGQALREDEFRAVEPEVDPEFKGKGILGKREEFETFFVGGNFAFDAVFDVFTFQLPDYQVKFIWVYPAEEKTRKKWSKAVAKSMKTFKVTEMEEMAEAVGSMGGYDEIVAFQQSVVDQTPGWRLLEVPSKRYLIVTNMDDKKKINMVIKRLEASRDLFEEDFPPEEEITAVSVVRVCATLSDFSTYSGMGAGVAGYFSSDTEELVLYFDPDSGEDLTLSVMTHEGFHQYCHFLFDRSKAHRWFDEGSGDYYGAFKLSGSKLKPNEDMKGGLARVPQIKEMLKNKTHKPLSKHIRFSHQEWQTQGPTNVSCYAQSFSIIYFLREGARGRVSKKYWKDEYADIIPNYIRVLHEGYQEVYEEQRTEIQEQIDLLEEAGEDVPDYLLERLKRPSADQRQKEEIWTKSMAESWGKIDESEFEQRWIDFVLDKM